jgi:hypothetical protein
LYFSADAVQFCNSVLYIFFSMSRSHTPDPLSPESQQPVGRSPGLPPSPTMQQRIKAIGVPTPLAMSSPIRRYVLKMQIALKRLSCMIYFLIIFLINFLPLILPEKLISAMRRMNPCCLM